MSPLNTSNLHRVFDKLDRNGDGFLSLDEFAWFLERIGAKTSEDDLELLLGQKGLDRVDFAIFYDVVVRQEVKKNQNQINNVDGKGNPQQQQMLLENDDLVKAFEVFDLNGDGFICSEELQTALCRLGLLDEKRGKDCESIINVYDTNSDGKLDFEEFKNMMFSAS